MTVWAGSSLGAGGIDLRQARSRCLHAPLGGPDRAAQRKIQCDAGVFQQIFGTCEGSSAWPRRCRASAASKVNSSNICPRPLGCGPFREKTATGRYGSDNAPIWPPPRLTENGLAPEKASTSRRRARPPIGTPEERAESNRRLTRERPARLKGAPPVWRDLSFRCPIDHVL